MNVYLTGTVISVITFIVIIVIGVLAGRKVKDTNDYYVVGRKAPVILIVGSLIASFLNTGALMGDTGEMLIGVSIPRWEEAVSLAKELADVCPDNHYTGWDLALTDDGWVMVEGNDRAMFGFQQYEQTGFRPEYDEICRRLGKKTSAHIHM